MKLYKKVKKSESNLKGIELCQNNPFVLGPCLLCIAAIPHDKSVFGLAREGMEAARLRTSKSTASGYDIENNPVSFLALPNPKDQENLKDLVDTYILPLISENNKKIDINIAKKNVRNMNIMTYCDGAKAYLFIESYLKEKMNQLGYFNDEIKNILKECAFIAIGTSNPSIKYNDNEVNISDMNATTFQFLDIMDSELEDDTFPERLSKINKNDNKFPHLLEVKDNHAIHTYIGNGEHDLKEYIGETNLVGATISKTITLCLKNSIKNNESTSFIELDINNLKLDVAGILNDYRTNKTLKDIFNDIDSELYYPNAIKYTDKEAIEITNEEEVYKELERLVSEIYRSKKDIQDILIKLKTLLSNIELLLPDRNNVLNGFNIPEYNIKLSIDTSIPKDENIQDIFNSNNRTIKMKKLSIEASKINQYLMILNRLLNELIYDRLFKCNNFDYNIIAKIMLSSDLKQYPIPKNNEERKR